MRLVHYLSEEHWDKDYLLMIIQKECVPVIKLMKKKQIVFDRQTKWFDGSELITKMYPRTNRLPVDTPEDLHKIVDHELKKMFGWGVRSEGIFCWARKVTAAPGNHFKGCVLPIGNFKAVFAKTGGDYQMRDMFNFMARKYEELGGKQHGFLSNWQNDTPEFREKFIKTIIDTIHKHFTDDLNKIDGSVQTGEVSIKCKEYYMVDRKIIEEFLQT